MDSNRYTTEKGYGFFESCQLVYRAASETNGSFIHNERQFTASWVRAYEHADDRR